MKRAFTLIELIFVIVLLGILGAVALTKLNATREDAIAAKKAKLLTTAINEIASNAIGQDNLTNGLEAYSNVLSEMVKRGEVVKNGSDNNLTLLTGSNHRCVTLALVNVNREQKLDVTYESPGGDAVCSGLQKILHNSDYSLVLKKQMVRY